MKTLQTVNKKLYKIRGAYPLSTLQDNYVIVDSLFEITEWADTFGYIIYSIKMLGSPQELRELEKHES